MESHKTNLTENNEKTVIFAIDRSDGSMHSGTGLYPSDYFPQQGCIYLKIEIHDNDQLLPDAEYNTMRQKKCDGYMRRGMVSKDT